MGFYHCVTWTYKNFPNTFSKNDLHSSTIDTKIVTTNISLSLPTLSLLLYQLGQLLALGIVVVLLLLLLLLLKLLYYLVLPLLLPWLQLALNSRNLLHTAATSLRNAVLTKLDNNWLVNFLMSPRILVLFIKDEKGNTLNVIACNWM